MTEPYPCPFCGSTDLKVVPDLAEDDNNRIYAYHVFCRDCHATGRNNYPIGWCESEQEAIEAWNDRFIPSTIPGDITRVQLSTTALLHIHGELENITHIQNHIADLLTPIQMNSNVKSDSEKVLDLWQARTEKTLKFCNERKTGHPDNYYTIVAKEYEMDIKYIKELRQEKTP